MKSILVSVLVMVAGVSYTQLPEYVPEAGLIGWWDFDGSADDGSGMGNHGTVYGATLTTDRFGNPSSAYELTVSGGASWGSAQQRIVVSDPSIPDSNSFTMSSWVLLNTKPAPYHNRPHTIMGRWDGNGTAVFRNQLSYEGNVATTLIEGGAFTTTISDESINYDEWHHIVTSYDGDTLKQYIDGILENESFLGGDINLSNTDLTFGELHMDNGHWYFLDGKIDESGYWSRVLTECEVLKLFNNEDLNVTALGLDTELCYGENLTLTGDGAVTYEWDGDVVDGAAFVPDEGEHVYTVTGTDLHGCQGTDSIEIVVYGLPEVEVISSDTALCHGEELTLTVEGAVTYVWDGDVVDGEAFIPEVGEYVYTVIGTDDNGCESTDSVDIIVHDLPVVTSIGSDTVLCHGESLILTGEGAVTYEWGGGVIDDEAFIPDVGEHVYTVTGTDDNGCEDNASIEILVNDNPAISSTTIIPELFGEDGSIDITVSGGTPAYSFDWDNDGTGDFDDDKDLTGISGGTYIVVVEDELGCTVTHTVTVNSQLNIEGDQAINLTVYPNPTSCVVTIELEGSFVYSLIGINGKVLVSNKGINQVQLDLSEFADGIYFLEITTENRNRTIQLIKQ